MVKGVNGVSRASINPHIIQLVIKALNTVHLRATSVVPVTARCELHGPRTTRRKQHELKINLGKLTVAIRKPAYPVRDVYHYKS